MSGSRRVASLLRARARARLAAVAFACVLALSGFASGCGGGDKRAPNTPEQPRLTLRIASQQDTNAGRPLRVLVRSVDFKSFVEESYQDVAALVVAPDDSVRAAFVIFPGSPHSELLDAPADDENLAVYFLFTDPATPWKRLYEAPIAEELQLELSEHSIVDPDDEKP
ncbi:hypothetical protein [Haliangium ochraceum]|uniref:Type VI lipoprotein IgE-like C-terminal domain-containing protein n=1 Tax=Haliangium ochraceum (strain DSM 14365 / JCM 11303 / SMP-2) TaxID=502025 RepID=D0LR52_HALO1|nr:hypothetical protein [Haliangium ochraceum]ACY15560.1 hypothetical protein Hoch_3054 [Haliangium ochraceum DSM 14365]